MTRSCEPLLLETTSAVISADGVLQARFELLQRGSRNVGDVLLGRGAEIEAALMVMGGFGHARRARVSVR